MITTLTPKNEIAMRHYVDKWINIGYDTGRLNVNETIKITNDYRKYILNLEKSPVIIFDNPLQCWVACHYVSEDDSLINDIDSLRSKVDGFFNLPKKERKKIVKSHTWPYQDGSYFASTFSFYDYMINELGVEIEPELLNKYYIWQETSKIGPIYPLEKITFVSQKAKFIKVNDEGQLHCDGDAAAHYAPDFDIYSLFGVRVKKEYAVTPSHKLDIDTILSEKNADVRSVLIRKIGIERLLEYGRKIDTYENYDQEEHSWWWKSEYELWDMSELFQSIDYAPHLKMLNQTTGIWHVEAVSPACQNIQDALKERFGEEQYEIMKIS